MSELRGSDNLGSLLLQLLTPFPGKLDLRGAGAALELFYSETVEK